MEGYDAATYGDRIADIYDETWQEVLDPTSAVEVLAELARGGPVLELAIGTGRVALPLAERGLEVQGIDISEEMVAKLREKPGGSEMKVTMGDFADVAVDGKFSLIFVVFNTLFALGSQEDQIRCFANAASHLVTGGVFVTEVFYPDLGRFDRHQRVQTSSVELDRISIEFSRHDPVRQLIDTQQVVLTEQGPRFYPVHLRYSWPSEIDLMARLAGMKLRDRWGGWNKEPFTSDSRAHVSVYELS